MSWLIKRRCLTSISSSNRRFHLHRCIRHRQVGFWIQYWGVRISMRRSILIWIITFHRWRRNIILASIEALLALHSARSEGEELRDHGRWSASTTTWILKTVHELRVWCPYLTLPFISFSDALKSVWTRRFWQYRPWEATSAMMQRYDMRSHVDRRE